MEATEVFGVEFGIGIGKCQAPNVELTGHRTRAREEFQDTKNREALI